MKFLSTLFLMCLAGLSLAQRLDLKWTSDSTLRIPESVLYDEGRNLLYISNIDGAPDGKDGKGFISQMTTDGKIKNLEWVSGLDSPKGMGLYKNNLYVTDLTDLVIIDVPSGKITKRIPVEGAVFLNDVSVDKKGTVYFTDSRTGKVYVLNGDKAEIYLDNSELKGTNGVLVINSGIYIVDFSNGHNYKVGKDKKLNKFSVTGQGADGIVALGNNDFLVSSWPGEVYYVSASGESKKLLDTKDQKISAADLGYDPKTKTVYVPTFFKNSVMAYTFVK